MKKIIEWIKAKLNIRSVVRRKLYDILFLILELLRYINSAIFPYIETKSIFKIIYISEFTYKHEHGTNTIIRIYIIGIRIFEKETEKQV